MIQHFKNIVNANRLNIQSFIRKVCMRFKMPQSEVLHLKPRYSCPKKWYGSSYGGFYLNPKWLGKSSIVYSFGIGKDISFDKAIIKNHQCHVYGFDPTPVSINYTKSLKPNPYFHFYEYGIASVSKKEKFYLPVHKKGISGSMVANEYVNLKNFIEVEMKSLKDIMDMLGHSQIDVLKIDIEGAEYEVLESIMASDIMIKQLLVEFHDRFFKDEIKSVHTVEMLKKKGFEIFAASMNYEEISFINTKMLI